MDKALYQFSCIVVSAANPDNLNESINIKNPYGITTFEIALTKVRLALIACSNTPVVWIIFDIKTEEEERYTKIVLDSPEELANMSEEEIIEYLRRNAAKELGIQMPKI